MYGFSPTFDGRLLVSSQLSGVSFHSNLIVLQFGDVATISVWGALRHATAKEELRTAADAPEHIAELVALLDRTVERVEVVDPSTLWITLREGGHLTFVDETPGAYESFSIDIGAERLIV